MSYSQVSHIAHDSYPGPGPGPAGMLLESAPVPPPRPGFEQGYGGAPMGYQHYLRPQTQLHPYDYPPSSASYGYGYGYGYDNNPCSSLLRACVAALCCCCVMEGCCPRW